MDGTNRQRNLKGDKMDICLKCARFPFCKEADKYKKECNNFIKRSY